MKTFILATVLGFAACARLDNLYLPASQRSTGGAFGGQSGGGGFGGSAGGSFGGPAGGAFGGSSGGSFGGQSGGGFGAQTYSSNNLKQVPILKFAADNSGEGSYRYNYETGNSISAEEQGEARGDGTKAHGSFSYISPEGEHISVSYTADENGFVPQGSHIPTPPPIPEAILKSLQENAAAEARGVFDDGQYRGDGQNDGQYRGEGQGSGAFGRTSGGSGAYAANGGYRY